MNATFYYSANFIFEERGKYLTCLTSYLVKFLNCYQNVALAVIACTLSSKITLPGVSSDSQHK